MWGLFVDKFAGLSSAMGSLLPGLASLAGTPCASQGRVFGLGLVTWRATKKNRVPGAVSLCKFPLASHKC